MDFMHNKGPSIKWVSLLNFPFTFPSSDSYSSLEKLVYSKEINSIHAQRLLSGVPKPAVLLSPQIYRLSHSPLCSSKDECQISKCRDHRERHMAPFLEGCATFHHSSMKLERLTKLNNIRRPHMCVSSLYLTQKYCLVIFK